MVSVIITSILWMTLYFGSCKTDKSDKDSLIFIRNPIEGEVPGHWIPKRVLKNIMAGAKPPIKPEVKDIIYKSSIPPPTPHKKKKPHGPPYLPSSHNPPYTPEKDTEEPIETDNEEKTTTEESIPEESTPAESTTEEPKTEEPKTEEPKTEEPKTEEPITEEPTTEGPTTQETTAGEEYETITDSPEEATTTEVPVSTSRNSAHSKKKRQRGHKGTDSRNKKK